jgi:rare lipoprotein A
MSRRRARACLVLPLLLLAACSSTPDDDDGPPEGERVTAEHCPDPDKFPDAVPKREPRAKYGNPASYKVRGERYHVSDSAEGYSEKGMASWYGKQFHGRRTSSGEEYDMHRMTAAHKTLPLITYVLVTNLENGREAILRVNDRGPFHDDRIIDLSYAAAQKLCILRKGTARVKVETIDPAGYQQFLIARRKQREPPRDDSEPVAVAAVTPMDESAPIAESPSATTGESAVAADNTGVIEPVNSSFDRPVPIGEGEMGAPAPVAALPAPAPLPDPAPPAGGFVAEGEPPPQPPQVAPAGTMPPPADMSDRVIQPVPGQTGTPATYTPTPERLYLQAGAFTFRENADALAQRLKDAGLTGIQIGTLRGETAPVRVRLGPYVNREALNEDRERLISLGVSANVVKE